MPEWPPTVPDHVYDTVADKMGEPYADSYLWGALFEDGKLTPRTVIAWERLTQIKTVVIALSKAGVLLVKPKPWGSKGGSQRSWVEVAPDLAEERSRPKRRRPSFDPW